MGGHFDNPERTPSRNSGYILDLRVCAKMALGISFLVVAGIPDSLRKDGWCVMVRPPARTRMLHVRKVDSACAVVIANRSISAWGERIALGAGGKRSAHGAGASTASRFRNRTQCKLRHE